MTRQEILSKYRVVDIRPPRKGELFIAVQWFNGDPNPFQVVKAIKTFNKVCLEIVEPL